MATIPTFQINGVMKYRPWYRRTTVLIGFALIAAVAGWVSGLFQFPLLSNLTHRVDPVPAIKSASTKPLAAPTYVIPPQPVGNDSSVSPVPLPLLLTGTMPGRNAHEGTAFIGVNKDSPQTYVAGAMLANGARIAEIYTDHVVLEKDGTRGNLYLLGSGKQIEVGKLSGLLTVGGIPAPPQAKITSHEVLTDYLRPSPIYEGQALKGYQVYPGQHAGVFSQLGLLPGDVIIAINGAPLNEPNAAIEQLKQLTEGYVVTAIIERQGKTDSISLDGALITQDQQRQRNPVEQPINMPGI